MPVKINFSKYTNIFFRNKKYNSDEKKTKTNVYYMYKV